MINNTIERLRAFLAANLQSGYGGAPARRLPDGTNRIRFERDGISFEDRWAGGDPFGGHIIVSIEGRPTWACVYYGAVMDPAEQPSTVYAFLRRALLVAPAEFPVRGPRTLADGELRYSSSVDGDLARFVGQERIARRERTIYEGTFAGGLVDRQAG